MYKPPARHLCILYKKNVYSIANVSSISNNFFATYMCVLNIISPYNNNVPLRTTNSVYSIFYSVANVSSIEHLGNVHYVY